MTIPAVEVLEPVASAPSTFGLMDELPAAGAQPSQADSSFGLMDELPDPMQTASPLEDPSAVAGTGTLAPLPAKKHKKPKRERASLNIDLSGWSWRWAFIPGLLGVVLLFAGHREWKLASLAKSTPQKMTLAQLVADGPGDNIYIELSGVNMILEETIVSSKNEDLNKGGWEYAWVPAISADPSGPEGKKIKVLVHTTSCDNEPELRRFCNRSTFTGLVVNSTDSLKKDERDLLNTGLRGVDASTCYLFRAGQKPASGAIQMLLLGGGAIGLVAGLGVGGLKLRNQMG